MTPEEIKPGNKYTILINKVSHKRGTYWCRVGDTVTIISLLNHDAIVETKNGHRFTTPKNTLK